MVRSPTSGIWSQGVDGVSPSSGSQYSVIFPKTCNIRCYLLFSRHLKTLSKVFKLIKQMNPKTN